MLPDDLDVLIVAELLLDRLAPVLGGATLAPPFSMVLPVHKLSSIVSL